MTQEQMGLQAVLKMTERFQAADLEGVMAAYEESATVAFEPAVPTSDRDRIASMFSEMFALSPRFEYGGHEVLVHGDLALHVAPWTMAGVAPDGSRIDQEGLSVAVLRRQRDGNWRIVIDNPHGQHLLGDPKG